MTSTSTPPSPTRRRFHGKNNAVHHPFHAPPLRSSTPLDIAKDLDAVRRRRNLLTQRIGAVWLRGHVRDLLG